MKSWIKMAVCVLAIWGFIKYFPMVLGRISSYQAVIDNSEKLEIDNAALFYSEESHTSVAERKLKEQLNSE